MCAHQPRIDALAGAFVIERDLVPASFGADLLEDLFCSVARLGDSLGGQQRRSVRGGRGDVGPHAEIDRSVSSECTLVDVDLHDLGVVGDESAVTHCPHVQPAPPTDNEVGVGDEVSGEGRRKSTRNIDSPRFALEHAARDRGGGE